LGFYKRNRSFFLILLGTGLMAISVFWEYARVKPDYRFIVEPWSIRGYETTQGWVIAAGALAALALALPLSLHLLKGKLIESLLVAGLATAFVALAAVLADAPDQQPGGMLVWGLAFLLGVAVVALVSRPKKRSAPGASRPSSECSPGSPSLPAWWSTTSCWQAALCLCGCCCSS
jgi:peptidoglycan/LPS O-acetylase OafA/YrhL